MKKRAFKQVDVFTATPYRGNPLAVVLDGDGLSGEEMQHFTNWTNLSECTFLLPPAHAEADYRVRIFCPGRELPFAGHPTLGSCHAWLQAGGVAKAGAGHIVQECGVGLVTLRSGGGRLAFSAPPLRKSGPLPEADVALIARGLRIARADIVDHAWCDNGPNWRGVMLRSAAEVLALQPDASVLAGLDVGVVGPRGKVGVVGPTDVIASGDDCAFEVRAFFPGNNGLAEDPVTGSLNAALAQWLIGAGLAPDRYIASQGTAMGRAGRVYVERIGGVERTGGVESIDGVKRDGGTIWIGGGCVTCVDGTVLL